MYVLEQKTFLQSSAQHVLLHAAHVALMFLLLPVFHALLYMQQNILYLIDQ